MCITAKTGRSLTHLMSAATTLPSFLLRVKSTKRKRAAQVAASASESSVSAPASAVYSNQPVSLPLLSQVPDHLLTPKKCKSRRKKTAQNTALGPEPVESAPASPEQVESAPASPESVESAPASPESVESAPASS